MADYFDSYLKGVQMKAYQSQLARDTETDQARRAFYGAPQQAPQVGGFLGMGRHQDPNWQPMDKGMGESVLRANEPAEMDQRDVRQAQLGKYQQDTRDAARAEESDYATDVMNAMSELKKETDMGKRKAIWDNSIAPALTARYPSLAPHVGKIDITDEGLDHGRAEMMARGGGSKTDGSDRPIAVIGDDGQPVYMSPDNAVGRKPAPGRENQKSMRIQDYEFWQKLPQADKDNWFKVQRAIQYEQTGGGTVTPADPMAKPGEPVVAPEVVRARDKAQAAAKAEGDVVGTATGTALTNLPKVESDAKYTTDLLEKLINHPGLPMRVGASSMVPALPGSPGADFDAVFGQIKGKRFLIAYEQLRGSGAITGTEGEKGEAAINGMANAQSEEAFVESAKDFEAVIERGLRVARRKAKGDFNTASPSTPDATPAPVPDDEYEAAKARLLR